MHFNILKNKIKNLTKDNKEKKKKNSRGIMVQSRETHHQRGVNRECEQVK